jgi:hypothetical protein
MSQGSGVVTLIDELRYGERWKPGAKKRQKRVVAYTDGVRASR